MVSGDTAYTVGAIARCTATANGRIRVSQPGVDSAGAFHHLLTDTAGGLAPAAASIGSVQYCSTGCTGTLTASTIKLVGAAATTGQPGIGYKFQVEGGALSAPLYVCYHGQSTTCSATLHDDYLAVTSSTDGTRLNYEWPVKDAVYVFTTATLTAVKINVTRAAVN